MIDNLEIVHPNASELVKLDQLEFAMIRRDGFGASDSSILLNVNPFKKIDTLIQEKCSTNLSEDEIRVGKLASVRKGSDLEPIILQKFEEWSGREALKPKPMYRIPGTALTVNFDGLIDENIPVEAKVVTSAGQRYYKMRKALIGINEVPLEYVCVNGSPQSINEAADHYGIPAYYYTQIQQQMLATGADHGYLAALFDKDWNLLVFYVHRSEPVIKELQYQAYKNWEQVQRRLGK